MVFPELSEYKQSTYIEYGVYCEQLRSKNMFLDTKYVSAVI